MTLLSDAPVDTLLEVLHRRADGLVHVEEVPARPARFAASGSGAAATRSWSCAVRALAAW